MKHIFKITFALLLLCNIFNGISMEILSEDFCDAGEDEAVAQWYFRVNDFIQTNQNLTQQIQQLHHELLDVKSKLDQTQQQLKDQELLKNHHNYDEIVVQRRMDGSVDFYRTWDDYKRGFGNTTGEFFLGLEKIHELTNTRPYSLLIVMIDWENQRRYAKYDRFIVGSEQEKYPLQQLGAYTGSAGDSLAGHLGLKFTTKDQKNDAHSRNCAEQFQGAWWYGACHSSNLNGLYLQGTIGGAQWAQGVIWQTFKDYTYSLKFVEMLLIRS